MVYTEYLIKFLYKNTVDVLNIIELQIRKLRLREMCVELK